MKKILVIRNDNIGDLVCTLPLARALHTAFPNAKIDLLANSYNRDIALHEPTINHIWAYAKAKHCNGWGGPILALIQKGILLLRLRYEKYDQIFIANPLFNKRTVRIASFLAPCKEQTIFGAIPQEENAPLLPKNYQGVPINHSLHHVQQVFSYTEAVGITQAPPRSVTITFSAQEQQLIAQKKERNQSEGKPLIGLQISARRPQQQWPAARWKEMIDALLPWANIQLFWSPGSSSEKGHPGDDALAYQLAHLYPLQPLQATPIKNLRTLLVGFASTDLVVGPDGGAMHIAAASGVPTLSLFGDIDPTIWAAYSEQSYFLQSPSKTILDIPVERVLQKIEQVLPKKNPTGASANH